MVKTINDYKFKENDNVTLKGWIFSVRKQADKTFIQIMDGSTSKMIQGIITTEKIKDISLSKGTSIEVIGIIKIFREKPELHIETLNILGECNSEEFPISKNKLGLDFLRKHEHLRIRTHTIQSVMRVRHTLSMAIHQFFDKQGYFNIHTPLLSSNDCEGAGETFTITSQNPFKKREDGKPSVIYANKELFKKPVFLTVSGQLHGESYATAMNKIYTFGPTFRAEKSDTNRHLSEFWMVEPEVSFINQSELHLLAQDLIKFCLLKVLTDRKDDLQILSRNDKTLVSRLETYSKGTYPQVSYDEAIKLLNKKFEEKVEWGIDLTSEHEKYLAEEVFKSPVICYNYPAKIKSFYMKPNLDNKTVQSMDLLVPGIGELIGGSMREDNYDNLKMKLEEKNITNLEWYLDLRKFGSVPHGGFGLGFERLVQFCTGMKHIRDVIPYPRYYKHCNA